MKQQRWKSFVEIVPVRVKDNVRPEKNPNFPNKPTHPESGEKGRRQWNTKTILKLMICAESDLAKLIKPVVSKAAN